MPSTQPMDVESLFWKLVDNANDVDDEAWRLLNEDNDDPVDSNWLIEPAYVAICKLVTAHPAERDVFVRCFSELVLQRRKSPWMLVPFCMRALRMPEIKDTLHREMDNARGTARYASLRDYCSSVMHAYQEGVWEHAAAFDHFAHEL